MEWPEQSPDLNPIENLWDQLTTMIQEQYPTNVTELWNAVKAPSQGFPLDKLIILISKAVIKAHGGATKH